jgi:hypothetical protein
VCLGRSGKGLRFGHPSYCPWGGGEGAAISIAQNFAAAPARLCRAKVQDFDKAIQRFSGGLPSLESVQCTLRSKDSHAYLFKRPG